LTPPLSKTRRLNVVFRRCRDGSRQYERGADNHG
jgi:hypothetical protein